MKKIFITVIISIILISCSTMQQDFSNNNYEKDKLMTENNSSFTNVAIIGNDAAYQIEQAKKKGEEEKNKEVITKLQKINGINVTVNDDNSIKTSLPNDILFDFNSAEINEKAKTTLKEFSIVILETDSIKLEITGHTDNIGTREYNQLLSEARAKAVSNILKDSGIKEENMKTFGKGFTAPVENNNTSEGRRKNRRVEIVIINK